jgi:CelD/BcsL family acetyltransferase involved in cellulose biosynthesis
LTHEWLSAWWRSFGAEETVALSLTSEAGQLLGGAVLAGGDGRIKGGAINAYSSIWDVVAADDDARMALWTSIARRGRSRLSFIRLPGDGRSRRIAPEAIRQEGFHVAVRSERRSPYIDLPRTWEDLIASLSSNSRSQVRKKRRRIERAGRLRLRTATDAALERDLNTFFNLEASGWKGEAGTAILQDPPAKRLFEEFAHEASERGWLRLQMLELDGKAIAADYSCVLGDSIFVLKTCFDEAHSRLSPGTVLRGESIRSAIEQGLSTFEWLGAPDAYKLHWGGNLHSAVGLYAYRGPALPAYAYKHLVRPAAARAIRALPPRRSAS